jgi:hypothetical protein
MSDFNIVCDSYDVANQSSTTETNYIPKGSSATNYSPVRLSGLFITPTTSGSWDNDRRLIFKDKKTDEVLFEMFVSITNSSHGTGGFNAVFPGNGIRCPNGVKFDTVKTYQGYVGVFYE